MTRGKHGNRAANRRAVVANETLAELKAAHAAERQEHKGEVTALKAELQSLQGDFTRKVKEASAEAIQEAHDAAAARVADVEDRAGARIRDALRFLFANAEVKWWTSASGGAGDLARFADLVDIPLGELLGMDPNATLNHAQRRMTSSAANKRFDARRRGMSTQ